jgi:hypothetical protein
MGRISNRLTLLAVAAALLASTGGGFFGAGASGVGRAVGFHW